MSLNFKFGGFWFTYDATSYNNVMVMFMFMSIVFFCIVQSLDYCMQQLFGKIVEIYHMVHLTISPFPEVSLSIHLYICTALFCFLIEYFNFFFFLKMSLLISNNLIENKFRLLLYLCVVNQVATKRKKKNPRK